MDGQEIPCIQHVWNVTNDHKCEVLGLANGSTYRWVNLIYSGVLFAVFGEKLIYCTCIFMAHISLYI